MGTSSVKLLESVDNALQALLLLADHERLRVSDVATELGIGMATAHRLLATLRYRGFVEQQADRSYVRGAALRRLAGAATAERPLDQVALPHLTWLRDRTEETTHLSVLEGNVVHFLASVESGQALRVTSRVGARLPAHHTSGGKAILAALAPEELDALYPPAGVPSLGLTHGDVESLHKDLRTVRRRGYGLNRAESERGIAAIGMCLFGSDRRARGAVSVSVPSIRMTSARLSELVALLDQARRAVEAELAE